MGVERIEVEKIENYFENPRHDIGLNELDTLKKLFNVAGHQNMINLAQDIYINGLVNASLVTVVKQNDTDKYTVYEGNRRVACIKLILYPDQFSFLSKNQIDRINKMKKDSPSKIDLSQIECLVTDEEDAFFIMRRLHSGEDKGKGPKAWNPREQETFLIRTSPKVNISIANVISDKYEEFFNEDIQKKMAYTNIQRLFNNLEVKEALGIEKGNMESITIEKMNLIRGVIDEVNYMAETENFSISRKFNKRKVIEQILLPIIENLKKKSIEDKERDIDNDIQETQASDLPKTNSPQKENYNAVLPLNTGVEEDSNLNLETKSTDEEVFATTSTPELPSKIGSGNLLIDTVPFTNIYRNNLRINTLIIEVNKIKYKDFRLATQYLLRSLMEVYGHEYVDYFANIDHKDSRKMKSIAKERIKRTQTVNRLYADFISNHIKENYPIYAEQAELIDVSLSENNNSSLMRILNFMVHSQNHIPDSIELVEAWCKIKSIIEAIDSILYQVKQGK
ncbi:hypothetical protein [Enterococcus sp. AZ101]|uniref:hypothetical protein n=1 Tax=Enterococcus sp. AZ101 TaxID=2774742 RepID=UPI003D2BC1C7